MSSMSMMTAAAPQAAPRYGAMGQVSEAAGGMDQLFVQIMQQLQALLDQTQGQADGSMLPQDGEALPPELLNDLLGFAEHLQGELPASDQDQLAELVQQLVEDGVPQEQVRQLAQTALLLQDAQRQGLDQPQAPAATLSELVAKIRTTPQEQINPAAVDVDTHSVDALLLLAERLRHRSPAESADSAPVTDEIETDEFQAGVDAANGRAPGLSPEPLGVASRPTARTEHQAAAEDHQAAPAIAAPEPLAASQTREAGAVQPLMPSSRAEPLSGGARSLASNEAPPGSAAGAGSGAESVAESDADAGSADSRQEGRRDDLREQGLARWVELRDTVFAQGQRLVQSEAAAFRGMLGAQALAERGELGSLSAAGSSASQMQLQQAYQAPGVNAALPGFGQRFGSQAWTPAASERISMMAGKHISTAELRLDPPELGSLRIKLSIQGDQTTLSFASPHAHVREVLEQQMPRLREMLADSGLQLGQTDVSDQSQSQGARDDQRTDAGGAGGEATDANKQQDGRLSSLPQSLALVDYYA